MADHISCPECGRQLRVPEQHRGRQARCPSCAACFVTPAAPPSEPEGVPLPRPETLTSVPGPALPRPVRLVSPLPEEDEPRGPRGNAIGLVAALIGVLTLVGLGISLARPKGPRATPPPPVPIGEIDEPPAEPLEAIRPQKPLEADAIADEVRPLLDELGKWFKRGDQARFLARFDLDRGLDELGEMEMVPPRGSPRRLTFVNGIRLRLSWDFAQWAPHMAWEASEIRRVEKAGDNEAVLSVRHLADGVERKMRWWVSKRSGSWKVFDMEDVDVGVRMTVRVAGVAAEQGRGGLAAGLKARHVGAAIRAVTVDGDLDAAERSLRLAEGGPLPRPLEAVRHLMTARVHFQRQRFKEALEALDQADLANPDMPCAKLWRGCAHNRLAEWDKGLTNLKAYHDLMGDDDTVCREMGEALRWLGRPAEAAVLYRKGLDCNPNDAFTFLALLHALGPGDRVDDLGRRFALLTDPHVAFDDCAETCTGPGDANELEEVARAMQAIDPGHAGAACSRALVRVWRQKTAEAVPMFRAAIAGEKDPARRSVHVTRFLQAMVWARKMAEGYAAAPDPAEAFRILAADLRKKHRQVDLRRLIALHEKKLPKDPLLKLYRAEAHLHHGRHALADEAFRAGEKELDAADLVPFQASRVRARFSTAGPVSALADIGPRKETFALLFSLCLYSNKGPHQCDALVDAYAKTDPDDPDLPHYRCRMKARQGRDAEATALFKTVLAKETDEKKKTQRIREFLHDMSAGGKTVEGYEAAPDARQAFAVLTYGFVEDGDPVAGLERLIEAHRRRHPDDPRLGRVEAEGHLRAEALERAVAAFAGAWKKADEEGRQELRHSYVSALYRAGGWRRAYREVGPARQSFQQLAYLLSAERKWEELEALVEAHRPAAGDDPGPLVWEALLKAHRKQPEEAVKLARRAFGTALAPQHKYLANVFVRAMAEAGFAIEGYRAAPDRSAAFEVLAGAMLARKKEKELAALVAEHGKEHPKEAALALYKGELHLLRGEVKQAEEQIEAAVAAAPDHRNWVYRGALQRVKVKAGKTVELYERQGWGPDAYPFEQLANVCVNEGNPRQLEALVAAHRRLVPDDETLTVWEAEVRWLDRDYESVVRLLEAYREEEDGFQGLGWKAADRLVRGLVRLKRPRDAVREAQKRPSARWSQGTLLILAHAANGDVGQAITAAEKAKSQGVTPAAWYNDQDLGPILRDDAFRVFRERFPEPKEQETGE